MADKLNQLVLDALRRAAASPAGAPLHASRQEPGLFPAGGAGRAAARKCLDEGWLAPRPGRPDEAALTDAGLARLADELSPREVLEDFVRAIEARQTQADELLRGVRDVAEQLTGLRAAVGQVLPTLGAARVPVARPVFATSAGAEPMPAAAPARAADPLAELSASVVALLSDYAASAGAGQDCPLPELYAGLGFAEPPPSIGTFHDCLRRLHEQRRVYLHPWTGPLYSMPEPALALLVGHEVAYYASVR